MHLANGWKVGHLVNENNLLFPLVEHPQLQLYAFFLLMQINPRIKHHRLSNNIDDGIFDSARDTKISSNFGMWKAPLINATLPSNVASPRQYLSCEADSQPLPTPVKKFPTVQYVYISCLLNSFLIAYRTHSDDLLQPYIHTGTLLICNNWYPTNKSINLVIVTYITDTFCVMRLYI